MSLAQQRLWILHELEGPSATYNIPVARRLRGPLDPVLLAAALDEVARRHAALRTTVDVIDGTQLMRIAAEPAWSLETVELAHLPEPQRLDAARSLAEAAADRPFDLTTGPLARTILLRLAEADQVLILVLHHLIADGWSVLAVDSAQDDPALPYSMGTAAELRNVVESLEAGDRVAAWSADVCSIESLEAAVVQAEQRWGGVDAAIAVAGVIAGGVPGWELSPAQEQAVLDVNLGGVMNLARAVVPAMLRRP